jgi:hypothetical protein
VCFHRSNTMVVRGGHRWMAPHRRLRAPRRAFSTHTQVSLHRDDRSFVAGSVVASTEAATGAPPLLATAGTFASGVHSISLSNGTTTATVLPFQGQQVWDLEVDGRTLTMKTMFEDGPRPVNPRDPWDYISTYGAFFVHCGGNSLGIPGPEDSHSLHGELPNARYDHAAVVTGEDERGAYIGVEGRYEHVVFCTANWVARPSCRLYAGDRHVSISMKVTNLFHNAMELFLLGHANFRPVAGSSLHYTHACTPEDVSVQPSVNGLVPISEEQRAFLAEMQDDPTIHNTLTPELMANLNPEVLFFLHKYQACQDGWATSMQTHPEGETADFIRHKPSQLDKCVRWMVNDPSHQCLGLALPGTSGPEGLTEARAKGNAVMLAPGYLQRKAHSVFDKGNC